MTSDFTGTEQLLTRLVRARSDNPPGNEAEVADVLEEYFSAHGIRSWRSEAGPGRPNVYAQVGRADGPVVMLNGHTDTVPIGPGWTVDPLGGIVRDGLLYGRGACDMKGGVVACAAALVRLAHNPDFHGTALFAGVVDEEVGAAGAKWLVEDGIRADAAIVAEPTGLEVWNTSDGQLNFQVDFVGTAMHTGRSEDGFSAIRQATRLQSALDEAKGYVIGTIAGGTAINIVPAQCSVGVDRRVPPSETLDGATAEFMKFVEEAAAGAPAMPLIRTTLAVPPLSLPNDHPTTVATSWAAEQVTGRRLRLGHAFFTTDAPWFAEAGIPTVICGPGDWALAHVPDEYVPIDEVIGASRLFELMAVRLSQQHA